MEDKQLEIEIPVVKYDSGDKKLLERVTKFKSGTLRIIVFTIVGMIMGWFGYTYTRDSFIVTKIIFAIPYKISEAIYTSIIGTDQMLPISPFLRNETEFFIHSFVADFLAEHVTPVLLGGAIYGGLAYFTGDKRIFTMQRFVKFFAVWIGVILIFIGSVYGVNAKVTYDNNHLKDVSYFYLISTDQAETITDEERSAKLILAFYDGLATKKVAERNWKDEIPLKIYYKKGMRSMVAEINTKECYLITQDGSAYTISKEFAGYVKEYYETGSLMGTRTIRKDQGV